MKKWLIWLIAILCILVVGAGIGTTIWAVNKKAKVENPIYSAKVDYLEDQYTVGDKIIFRGLYQSDKQLTGVKYSIDSGAEVALTTVNGKSDTNKQLNTKKGSYYIDTGTETLDTSTVTAGKHILTIYVYEDTTRIVYLEKVINFVSAK